MAKICLLNIFVLRYTIFFKIAVRVNNVLLAIGEYLVMFSRCPNALHVEETLYP